MTQISQELIEIENLKKTAQFHQYNCHDSECGVTLFMLKRTAERLVQLILALRGEGEELNKAREIIKTFPL